MSVNVYTGSFTSEHWYQVYKNGVEFDPGPSLKIRNHSPDGFSFGYSGSGPAQLALAILLEEAGPEIAEQFYMYFKQDVIANLPNEEGSTWTLVSQQILEWLKSKKR